MKITLQEFLKKTNIKKFKTFHHLKNSRNKDNNSNIYFFVDTSYVKFLNIQNRTTYTLKVEPSIYEENILYNIVYYKVDNSWNWSLLQAQINPIDNSYTTVNEIMNNKNDDGSINNKKSFELYWGTNYSYHCTNTGICLSSGICDLCNLCVSETFTVEMVHISEQEPVFQFEIAAGVTGGGGYSNPEHTNFINNLNNQQKQWYQDYINNGASILAINQFLNQNNFSQSAQGFAHEAIQAQMNGGEVDFDDIIIIDLSYLNNNCLSNVYTSLNNNSSKISTYLNNFMGKNSVANLKLQTSTSLPDNINVVTSPPNNYLITITFNANNLDRPSLSIARTFIHELIHAEMFRKLLSVWQSPSLNGLSYSDLENMRNDFPGLIDYYTRWKLNIPAGINLTSAQHQAMAQHYRDIIKQALKDFDNTQTENVYNALSWVGLHNTIAWNNLPQSEINTINQTIINFNLNNQNCQ